MGSSHSLIEQRCGNLWVQLVNGQAPKTERGKKFRKGKANQMRTRVLLGIIKTYTLKQ